MKKGLTPVIAVVLLIAITVGAVGTLYATSSDILNSQNAEVNPAGSSAELDIVSGVQDANGVNIYMRNTGDSTINISRLTLYYSAEDKEAIYPTFKNIRGFDEFNKIAEWKLDGYGSTVTDDTKRS